MTRSPASSLAAVLRALPPGALAPALSGLLLEAAATLPGAGADVPREPWLPLREVLDTLVALQADGDALAAAVLDALPALEAALALPLAKAFPGVLALVESQRAAAQVWALHGERTAGSSEGLRRLLLAIVRDLRVVPILLAQQLVRMRHASRLAEAPRRQLAQLTRDIHAPLANRLGIWQLKWELEDLAFRYLEPETYRRIAQQLDETRGGRERYIEGVKRDLSAALSQQGIDADISGRPKHIYSIWRKMQKKGLSFDELYDLRAVRVQVDDVAACYASLGVVHALWLPVPSEFDDYIARPKANDYRSLHTAVVGPDGRTVEIQIRTREMHSQAELGVAAHWRYKEGRSNEGKGAEKAFDRKIAWMRHLLDAQGDESLVGGFGAELAEERIYTLTPRGEVIDLPSGATPLDFAYHVHTMVGHRCRGAKVNGRIVPLGHVLHSGDRVEILTAKQAEPRRDWLLASNHFLASPRSRDKVRAWFHKLDRERNLGAGKELLEKELKRLGLGEADLAPVLKRFHVDSVDELHVAVALGDVGPSQVGRALHEHERAQAAALVAAANATSVTPRFEPRRARPPPKSKFTVQGVGNLLVQLARCCQPVAGEPIAGYLTRARGVTVHRIDCPAFQRLTATQPQRILPVEWGQAGSGYEVDVHLTAIDRKWLLKDITNLIAQEDAHVLDIRGSQQEDSGRVVFQLRLKVADYGQLSTLLGKLDALPGVHDARRAG